MNFLQKLWIKIQFSLQKPTEMPVENLTKDAYAPPVIVPPEPEKKPKSKLPYLLPILVILIIAVCYKPLKILPKMGDWVKIKIAPLKYKYMPKPAPRPIAVIAPAAETKEAVVASKPMTSPPAPASPAPVLNIQGIMTNNGSAVVLINGKVYQTGDDVDGTKLVSISENSITILRDGQTETVQLRH